MMVRRARGSRSAFATGCRRLHATRAMCACVRECENKKRLDASPSPGGTAPSARLPSPPPTPPPQHFPHPSTPGDAVQTPNLTYRAPQGASARSLTRVLCPCLPIDRTPSPRRRDGRQGRETHPARCHATGRGRRRQISAQGDS